MHIEPQWVNKLLFAPLIKNKQGEPKMTPCFTVLVKRVVELREARLKVCHSAEEFTLR
jgi:hypothetical protein